MILSQFSGYKLIGKRFRHITVSAYLSCDTADVIITIFDWIVIPSLSLFGNVQLTTISCATVNDRLTID